MEGSGQFCLLRLRRGTWLYWEILIWFMKSGPHELERVISHNGINHLVISGVIQEERIRTHYHLVTTSFDADSTEIDEPVFIYILHHEANLITVSTKHHSGAALRVPCTDHVAHHIGLNGIHVFCQFLPNYTLNGLFKPRWAGSFHQQF